MASELRIIRPPKIYIDTAHLINIASVRKGEPLRSNATPDVYLDLYDRISKHHVGLIYSQAAALDWVDGKATPETAREIAEVVDSAKLRFFYEGDQFLFLKEILDECARVDSALTVLDIPLLPLYERGTSIRTGLGMLAAHVPSYFDASELPTYVTDQSQIPQEIPCFGAQKLVDQTFRYKRQNKDAYTERVEGYVAALSQDIEARRSDPGAMGDFAGWATRFLRIDRVLRATNPTVDVEATLAQVDLARCPGTRLWLAAREKRIRAGGLAKPNDVDDWMFVPVVPYCDVVLTDKAHREAIVQGDRLLRDRVFADPEEAIEAIDHILKMGVAP